MKVEVKNFSLQELINKIELGDIQLPEFQRDYVWKQSDQKALLESIFYGYPIGSLLLLELDDKKPMFAWSMLKNITISDGKKVPGNPEEIESLVRQAKLLNFTFN